jgi:hypothetical protein
MPFWKSYDDPALVATLAAGVGQYAQGRQGQADSLARQQQGFGEAIAVQGLNQGMRRDHLFETRDQQRYEDAMDQRDFGNQLALDDREEQRRRFDTGVQMAYDRDASNQQTRLDEQQMEGQQRQDQLLLAQQQKQQQQAEALEQLEALRKADKLLPGEYEKYRKALTLHSVGLGDDAIRSDDRVADAERRATAAEVKATKADAAGEWSRLQATIKAGMDRATGLEKSINKITSEPIERVYKQQADNLAQYRRQLAEVMDTVNTARERQKQVNEQMMRGNAPAGQQQSPPATQGKMPEPDGQLNNLPIYVTPQKIQQLPSGTQFYTQDASGQLRLAQKD